jgi:hypothetical protein
MSVTFCLEGGWRAVHGARCSWCISFVLLAEEAAVVRQNETFSAGQSVSVNNFLEQVKYHRSSAPPALLLVWGV